VSWNHKRKKRFEREVTKEKENLVTCPAVVFFASAETIRDFDFGVAELDDGVMVLHVLHGLFHGKKLDKRKPTPLPPPSPSHPCRNDTGQKTSHTGMVAGGFGRTGSGGVGVRVSLSLITITLSTGAFC